MATDNNSRRFNTGDVLILIAALCVGLSGIRDRIQTFPARTARWRDDYRRFRTELAAPTPMSAEDYQFSVKSLSFYISDEGKAWLVSSLVGLTPAQVIMRLRRPRPSLQTLSMLPGFMACFAALIGYAFDREWIPYLRFPSLPFPLMTAMAVLIAWATLLILRRWKPDGTWLDRLGAAVAGGWIVAAIWSLVEQAYLW